MNSSLEHQSLVEIFQSHYGLIVAAASRHVPTPDLVYDVVNQVFIEFMEMAGQGRLDGTRDAGPLLYQMTKNTAIDYWRKTKKHSPEGIRKIGEHLMQMQQEDDGLEMLDQSMIALSDCLKKLPEKSREIIELHYLQQISLEKLSQLWSVPSATLRKATFRLRRKLRHCILQHLEKGFIEFQ